jgi:acetate kinase
MRVILRAAEQGDSRATLALAVHHHHHHHHLRVGIAVMAAAMGGLDARVFSGGVGEHAAAVRAGATDGLGFLGVRIDPRRNVDCEGDRDVTAPGSRLRTLVVAAREDLEIARQVQGVLVGSSPQEG